ncbi:MAG: N-acetylmuramoyl-L-alanine amidase [Gemmatimonadaceae bacterium]|nr:N-acetylmuramoyl-L-alanine amidase [Gemmatimonadaceae bacterium]
MTPFDTILDLLKRIAAALGITPTPTPEPSPPAPPPAPPPVPPPHPADAPLIFPAGTMKTIVPNGTIPYGFPWTQVSRWEPLYTRAGKEFRVSPLLLAAFSIIESHANHYRTGGRTGTREQVLSRGSDGYDSVPAVGMMQIKLGYHRAALPNADGYTPEGNLRLGAKLLAGWIKSEGSWEAALVNKYFPGDDSGSGITQQEYIRAIRGLIAEVKKSWSVPLPTPPPPVTPPSRSGSPYTVDGLSTPIILPFPLHVRLIPPSQTNQRPGQRMTPDRWVQHQTGNANRGANALMHQLYMANGAEGQQLGYHFAIDDHEAYQMIPVNEIAWHGGDGSGPCNYKGLSSELCMNADGNQQKARDNAAILAAEVMNAMNISSLKPHQACAGKWCPTQLLTEGKWPWFVDLVSRYRRERM